MPSLPIERGLPGPGLLAHIAISKFCDHQPLHRQSAIYARERVELDRALMADWMGKVVFLLTPLAEAIGRHIRAGEVLHADDTTVPVLSPGLGRTASGRLWVMVRDERPWGSPVPPAVLYRYSPDRKGADSDDAGQRFRLKPDADSDGSRTPIPIDPGQGSLSTWVCSQATASASSMIVLAARLRSDSPFSSRRWALWTRRSSTASAMVGSLNIGGCPRT